MASRVSIPSLFRFLQSPHLVAQSLQNGWRKRVTSRLDYHRSDGYASAPVQIDVKLVDVCNLKCKMCAQWGETGYNYTRSPADLKRILSLDAYEKLAADVATLNPKPWFYIWGGEPFMHPEFLQIVTALKARGFVVSVVTNGTKLSATAEHLVRIGIDVILVSIDGPRDTHDHIRGFQGAFEATTAGVRAVQREKKRQGKVWPYVSLMSVITRDNQDKLEELYEIGEDLEIDAMLTWYAWYQTWESGTRYTAILQEKLNVVPWSWRGWLWNVNEIDPGVVADSVRRLQARRWKFPYVFFPDLEYDEVPRYYRDHADTFGHTQCRAPWVMSELMPNGDVVTCRDYPDVVLGNIQHDSLLDIWNNERARGFRKLVKDEGLLPVCARCQGLMGL